MADAMGAVANDLRGVASDARQVANDFDIRAQEQEAAQAAIKDVEVSKRIREILYAPETGYLGQRQNNAVTGYGATQQEINGVKEDALKDLSQSMRARLEPAISRRVDSAFQKMAVHQNNERTAWLDGASQARVSASADDALAAFSDEGEINGHLLLGVGEIRNRAERLGWSSDQRIAAEQAYTSTTLKAVIFRRAQDDPSAALAYAQRNQERLTAGDFAYIEEVVGKESKLQQGRQWAQGQGAASLTGAAAEVAVSLQQAVISQESGGKATAESPVGASGLMQIMPATARDLASQMGIAGVASMSDAQVKQWLKANPEQNVRMGTQYLTQQLKRYGGIPELALAAYNAGPGAVDGWIERFGDPRTAEISISEFVSKIPYKETREYVPSVLKRMPEAAVVSDDRFAQAMQIKDPVVRDAALSELAKMQQIQNAAETRQKREAQDGLWEFVEQGGDPAEAPAEMRLEAGRADVAAAEAYHLAKQTGRPIKTDNEAYLELRNLPRDEFLATDLRGYRDRLSDADFKRMVDLQVAEKSTSVKERSIDSMLGPARRVFEAAGISKGDAGSKQSQEYARLESQVIRTVDQWESENPGKTMPRSLVMDVAKHMTTTYRDPGGTVDVELTPASLRSAAQPITRSLLGPVGKNADKYADFEPAHLEAARQFRARTGRDPSAAESQDIARGMLTEFHVDSGGFSGLFDGDDKFAYQITAEDLTALQQGSAVIEVDGRKITVQEIAIAAKLFRKENGYEPQIYQIMSMVAE
ncbi:MAG: transglycosylase SLT domain-containing protein [Paracoccaceae bacterium]